MVAGGSQLHPGELERPEPAQLPMSVFVRPRPRSGEDQPANGAARGGHRPPRTDAMAARRL